VSLKKAGNNRIESKCHTVTVGPEICVKMFIFKVDVQSVHLETKCSQVKLSQGKNVTVDVSSGSKCRGGRKVGGRKVKAPTFCGKIAART
jgi:hypothetical protein